MSQILSTTYLLILLFFLIILSYYISGEIIRNIQDENLFNLSKKENSEKNKQLDPLLHLSLVKMYSRKNITDAALYELHFLIKYKENIYSNNIKSKLYNLLGENFEFLQDEKEAKQFYAQAITICKDNNIAVENLNKLSNKK
nr:Ycf37 [Erythrotrichia welwitschii]